jgi:two-component system NtrC family sensor kinase
LPALFVIQGFNRGSRFDFTGEAGAVSIGREAGNLVKLDDHEVSRRHAEIRRVGEGFILGDLKSSNGTFVNDVKVERVELSSGDRIRIGRSVLFFSGDGREPPNQTVVDIVPAAVGADHSRIVRSMREED